jgi:5-(carboxyamino)imidazole ribonucleotide mutase
MGSDSVLKILSEAAKILETLEIPYSIMVASAHRTPELLSGYIKEMLSKGVKVFIAGAGGAAHLPGVVASMVTLPVIGVPINIGVLGGADSLYSIVQMPQGIPVATVAINGAANAGVLAAQILGASDGNISAKLASYKEEMKKSVEKKAERLKEIGYAQYLS